MPILLATPASGTPTTPLAGGVAGPVAVEIAPQYGAMTAASDAEVNVMVSVEGSDAAVTQRQPLDLAIVLDRSGSMAGDKLTSAKTAALELLKLLEPRDRVTLVTYSDDVRVESKRVALSQGGLSKLREQILAIRDGGGTALGPAVMQTLDILSEARSSERLAHTVLLSDGLANQGESSPSVLGRHAAEAFIRGVSLSTVGVGLDYNEDLMTQLADEGGGHYHFIGDNSMIAQVLTDELHGLVATVARNVVLTIKPPAGMTVTKVHGYAMQAGADGASAKIGSLRARQSRDVLVTLRGPIVTGGPTRLGVFSIGLNDLLAQGRAVQWQGDVNVASAVDAGAMAASEVTEVTVRVAELAAASRLEQAARDVERGDFKSAAKTLDTSIKSLRKQAKRTPSAELDQQIADAEQAKSDIREARKSATARKRYVKGKKSGSYSNRKKGKSRRIWKKKGGIQ